MEERKKILFVNRNPMYWKEHDIVVEWAERANRIIDAFREEYDVEQLINLLNVKDIDIASGDYDVMITHLQDDPKEKKVFDFRLSLDRLRRIHKENPELLIPTDDGRRVQRLYPFLSVHI